MAKNQVQFQRGMSLVQFLAEFGSEELCREALIRWRWPSGFRCPRCDHRGDCRLTGRAVFQCHRCHHQTSVTSGTIFAATKLPLRTWFLAIYLLVHSKVACPRWRSSGSWGCRTTPPGCSSKS